jgi:hypothetical protein
VYIAYDGLIELHDMGGLFAPHLFVPADDVADIPPPAMPADWHRLVDRIAELKRQIAALVEVVGLIEVDLTAGDMAAKTRVKLALHRVQALVRASKVQSHE